jgi:murein DD-endopeptidase MepM/ murein hydrolase activator NlpD
LKKPTPRAVTALVAGALAVLALSVDLPKPWLDAPRPIENDTAATAAVADSDSLAAVNDTLHSGETLGALLSRRGVTQTAMPRVMDAASALDERRVPAGMPITVRSDSAGAAPREIVFQLAPDRLLHVRRTGDSTWTSREEQLPWVTDTLVVNGRIDENLYQALDDSAATVLPKGARAELAWTLADIFEYRVDMSRDLQPGDAFRVLFERQVGASGQTRIGRVLAARMVLSGSTTEAVRFDEGDGHAAYYDATGRSMHAAFLRAPLAFRRISSVFGLRKHPILGIWRKHEGTDYVANAGTPVRTIGDGTITFAGRRGGYGNMIEVRHRNGLVSRYGHLRGFATGIRAGRAVTIGQTIGYVGMTGLATGPHLHFELLVDGTQRDPAVALRKSAGAPLAASERAAFAVQLTALLASLHKGDA